MEILTLIRSQWDRALAVVCAVVGLVMLLLGWIGVSGVNLVVKQMPYIMSGGIGGIIVVAIGAALWVSADLRDEWSELRRLRLTLDRMEQRQGLSRVRDGVEIVAAPADGAAEASGGRASRRMSSASATR